MDQALDMHLAVAILRVPKGLDYSQVLGEDVPISIFQLPKTIPSNDSSADLHDKSNIHGSCDSLSRNVSQGRFYGKLSVNSVSFFFIECTAVEGSHTSGNLFPKCAIPWLFTLLLGTHAQDTNFFFFF